MKFPKKYLQKKSLILCIFSIATLLSSTASADVSVPHAQADEFVRRIQASHFLLQATMGPTKATTEALADRIEAIGRDAAFHEWIDEQLNMEAWSSVELAEEMLERDGISSPSTKHQNHPTLRDSTRYYREHVWWHQSLYSPSQLRERMTWALYQIMPAYNRDARIGWKRNLDYMDLLKNNAFGDHRSLLTDVTYDLMMGSFLSSLKNSKGDESAGIFPDENYAREVMQLFSVGVYRIDNNARYVLDGDGNRVENYTNEDITQLARVFTGLSREKNHRGQHFFSANQGSKMIMWEDHHHQGTKTFLGHTLPANQPGDQDISEALDILINHSSTPYFFSNLLMQRFTTSTPNVNYLKRVAEVYKDNGQGQRGDFKAVIRAILMDSTVRDSLKIEKTVDPNNAANTLITVNVNLDNWENNNTQGRLREPMLQLTNFFKFFEADAKEHESSTYAGDFKPFWQNVRIGQSIRDSITIFGYYNSDFLPTTGPAANKNRNGRPLTLPEFELLPTSAVQLNEKIQGLSKNQVIKQRQTINSSNTPLTGLSRVSSGNSMAALIQELNVFLFSGTMSIDLQNQLLAIFNDASGETEEVRFSKAIAVLLSSADFAVTN